VIKKLLLTATFLLLTTSVFAEQKVTFGDYELHYIVLNTTEIPADIAKQYDIQRSRKRAFINLSILKTTSDGYGTPVSADVTAVQRTLIGQRADIELREIREGDAIYYIGSFQIINRETLWFDVNLTLKSGYEYEHVFSQQVWQE
jgi:hypothetical protein